MKLRCAQLLAPVALGAVLAWSLPDASASNPGVRQVVVVFKTHFDIGYTDFVTNVLTRYRTKFVDDAIKLIDASRVRPANERFVWTAPGWPLQQMGGLELSRRGVLVTSFGDDPYSDKTLLRLWEVAGRSGKLTVKSPAGFNAQRAVPVNLRANRKASRSQSTSIPSR